MNASDLKQLIDWLIDGARSAASPPEMMARTCERLVEAGLPLFRVGVFVRTLHPDGFGRNFIWRQGAGVEAKSVDYHILESDEFKLSVVIIKFREGIEVRARADDPQSER